MDGERVSFAGRALRALRERWRGPELALWLFAAWMVLAVIRGHLPYVSQPQQHNMDEGYLLAVGQRMLHGRLLPFVDGVAHGGPLFLWSGALMAAFGEFSWLPIRVASALVFAANTALVFLCGRAAGHGLAGAIGAASVPLFCLLWLTPWDGIAYNAEVLTNVFLLASLLCATRAVSAEAKPPSLRWTVAAGACAALAALSKQVGALVALPIAAYLLAAAWGRDLARATRVRIVLAFVAGAATPVAVLVVWFAAFGALSDFLYYFGTYNGAIYMFYERDLSLLARYREWFGQRPNELALLVAAAAWGLAQLFAPAVPQRSWLATYYRGFPITVAALALSATIGARASMRYFDHYYILIVPWIGLLVGLLIEPRASAGAASSGPGTLAYRLCLLVPVLLAFETSMSVRAQRVAGWVAEQRQNERRPEAERTPELCRFIADNSRPSDRLFVWGFHADLHVTCARLPASRYVFSTFVAGFVPWHVETSVEEEDRLSVPGSRGRLLGELRATKPVIVDAPHSLAGRSMTRYRVLQRFLDRHYRHAASFGDDHVYLPKSEPSH